MVKIINPQSKTNYQMPTKVFFGRGAINKLNDLIKTSNLPKLILVAGSHFYRSKKYKSLIDNLKKTRKVEFYPQRIKKSTFKEVNSLVEYVQEGGYGGIIGIGGGAILDSSKVAAALATKGGITEDYLIHKTSKLKKKGLSYIAIPTTSGTGSEVTPWAVVWGDVKHSLSSPLMFPDIAIVDPALSDDCPKYVTATSGIDALCQGIEAYWNINHNPTSDKYALEAIKTIIANLEKAVNNPTKKIRDYMAWGSLTGGLAFSNTATTICHAVSYPMTARFGIVHGQATSITLPLFIEYTFPALKKTRERKILKAMGAKNYKEAAEKIRRLILNIGLKTKLSELGVPRKGVDLIVKEGFDPTRIKNSPKVPSPQELQEMLYRIL